jgi:enoyl-CoA hydratase/carnithine racemase
VGVVDVDVRLLDAGPAEPEAAIDGLIGEEVGEPLLLRFDGAWPASLDAAVVGRAVCALPALTVAVGSVPPDLAAVFDLVTPDLERAARWETGFAVAPRAAVTAALLLRTPSTGLPGTGDGVHDVWSGLSAESAAYSMLLAGPEFARWRAAHPPRPAATTDDAPRVTVDQVGNVTRVTLTRGARHNAVDAPMRDELHAALAEAMTGPHPVVLRGDGPSFCSGGDLDTFGSLPDPATAHIIRLARSVAWQAHRLAPRLVVGLHGACLGAGIEIPAFAGHVVAADDATVGLPELQLGLIPGAGGTVSLARRSSPARVLELLLGDATIPAATARDWGLVDEVVPHAQLDARLLEIAESLA